ncbi:MAG TPA: hypothetical protein PK883_05180 [Anaerolineaceae bacterium]|nr:hypothetical protein [Anaerolineaceae bacterium]
MADIRCLICNRVNDSSAEHCWYCHTILPKPTGPLTQKERDKLASLKNKITSENNNVPEPPVEEPKKTPPAGSTEEEVPEWLARIRRLKQADELDQPYRPSDWIDEDQPDWLVKLQQPVVEETPETAETSTPAGKFKKPALDESLQIHNLPRESDDSEEYIASLLNAITPAASVDRLRTPGGELEELVENGWYNQSAQIQPLPVGSEDRDDLESDALSAGVEIPVYIEEPAQEPEPAVNTEPAQELPFPLFVDNLPDWLSTEETTKESSIEGKLDADITAGEISEQKIEKGQLPAWLQSLRPSAARSIEESASESTPVLDDRGVLAGIAGTLPGANLSGRVIKPVDFAQELRATAQQRKNADLFQSLLQAPDEPVVMSTDQKTASPAGRFVRFIVTILVLLAVILPILLPGFSVIVPVLFPTEVVNTLGTIQALSADKPVLVAAHFEAGLAGEIDWTAQPVLKQLVSRGIPLALTSTNVQGFTVLQDMVAQAIGNDPVYSMDVNVMNLGYLPGGSIGMGALVNDPLKTLPFTTDLQPVGESAVFGTLNSLSDLGALIILTDNPEFARIWVEQVDGGNAGLPILAVVSSQAAPLVQPYFASGQINGYISGMSGALFYEMLTMRAGSATARFNSYQLSLLLVAVLIFAGGTVSLILASPHSAKKKEAG